MVFALVNEFFCQPILQYSGYNPVNTIVYGLILLGIAFGIIYPYFNKKNIPFNTRFLLAVLPFVILGSSFRIFEDLQILPRSCNPLDPAFYTITPGIYILIGLLTILSLFVAIRIAGKTKPKNTLQIFGGIGSALALLSLSMLVLQIKLWIVIIGVLALTSAVTLAGILLTRAWRQTKSILDNNLNRLVFFGQLLDGSATFTALQFFNFSEQHVLSNVIIQMFGPIAFLGVKFALMLAILYYVDKEIEQPQLRGFVKIFIAIIGFAPGIRDTLLIAVGIGA